MLDWIETFAQTVSDAVTGTLGPTADTLAHYVWSWPSSVSLLVAVLLGTGLFVTLRLAFIQVRGFRHAIDIARGRYDDPDDAGDLKHYQALTTALSATVGIGNIAGVAIAIRMGGPGALFWMWVTAFFGMALKFVECTLSLNFRDVHPDGSVSGGPMYYIEKGLGKGWKWMAVFFASMAVICSFGSGNMNQSNTMADQVRSQFGVHPIWTALVASFLVGLVIIGGIRRIGKVTSVLAPAMGIMYVLGAMVVLLRFATEIPAGFALIFEQAFSPSSLVGGGAGSFLLTLMWGVRRGLFSNEAGQGSAPIAHATAKTTEPVREGLVASLGPFIDTLVICSMTGLVIVMTGSFRDKVPDTLSLETVEALPVAAATDSQLGELREARDRAARTLRLQVVDGRLEGTSLVYLDAVVEEPRVLDAAGAGWNGALEVSGSGRLSVVAGEGTPVIRGKALLTGAPLTARGFQKGLPGKWGDNIVTLAVLLFAVSTAISWSYYGDRGTEYLFGAKAIRIYRWVFVFFFFMGAILPLEAVWTMGDVALGLMSFPNLIAVLLLSGTTVKMTRDYFAREHRPRR